jgi:NADH-quinone oxidoreductase subunit G
MISHPLVSPHDGVGTNVFGHVLRGKLMRVVPRENEAINEIWIADRDRFSYEGVYSHDRLQRPLVRKGEEWVEVDWEAALGKVAEGLQPRAASFGVLASPSSTVEEFYLAGRIARGLGSGNIDHRLRQRDVRDQAADPVFPNLGMSIVGIDTLSSLLVIGSNLRREVPVLAHRVRKAARKATKVSFLNPQWFDYKFPIAAYVTSAPSKQVADLAAIVAAAAAAAGKAIPEHVASFVGQAQPDDSHKAVAAALATGEQRAIWLGALATRHAAYADLRALAAALAEITGASFGVIAEGGNAAGAYIAGAVPHREAGGKAAAKVGLSAAEMLQQPLKAYVLFGGVEPWVDLQDGGAVAKAEFVVAMTPFANDALKKVAHVILPIGTFAETSGTYVNMEGLWQSQAGAAQPVGEARPGWKVLRVLGNTLSLPGFEYQTSEDVREELRKTCGASATSHVADIPVAAVSYKGSHKVANGSGSTAASSEGVLDLPMYNIDALVRRAPSLQKTREGRTPAATY